MAQTVAAQISGTITDAATGDTIPYASAIYRGHHVAVSSNAEGHYSIERHEGWTLTFSAVGYQQVTVKVASNTPHTLNVKLKPDTKTLDNVVVKSKRKRYSRKDNPAVELMRRVIAAKKKTRLENHDYYQYNKYQKITLAFNDLTPKDLESSLFKKHQWLLNQVEVFSNTNKLILPISVDETVTQKIYRKSPHSEKDIIKGQNSTGINHLIETGDILNTALKDIFTDVDIYDDQVRLLQYPFTSPIGKDAIAFYRFYIEDTVYVDKDLCYHLQFLPNNQQDFGFRGEIYVLCDSTLHVKRCNLTIPKRSDVNFVENLQIMQEYTQLPNGEWALSVDDMFVEMALAKFLSKALVVRTTRLSDYAFDELPKQLFKGKAKERRDADAMMRDEAFWSQYRGVELTKSESSMDAFIHNIEQIKGFKWFIFGIKALVENFVETSPQGKKNYVDIGPVNTMITKNFVDGLRTRISAQTNANLNPHLFLSGYAAHGWKSKKNYYKAEFTYSFNKKEYLPREFPKRTLTFTSTYDVCSPSDKFVHTDKDNVFTAFKWSPVEKMMFYNRQQIAFEREEDWGFKTTLSIKTEQNEATGDLYFANSAAVNKRLSQLTANAATLPVNEDPQAAAEPHTPDINDAYADMFPDLLHHGKIRTTELHGELRFAPGETFINTKQRRIKMNLDAPVFTIGHTIGIKGFLGGDYSYHVSEASIYKRFWMKSWGKIDCYLKGGIQWSKVPYPLLIMPAANLSYIVEDETFNLVNNMEFLNDRYASLDISWDMNGKIFNRIPLLKKLKWREYLGVKCLWGQLTDKNNPTLAQNEGDPLLMPMPEGSYVMDKNEPYVELIAGIHNILKIMHVEYVRRLNYLNLPTASKHGIRFMVRMTF
ncbi:MAG: carboxypeptidase-like regulatory domain-containing protein [Prevotella sp.]|nr:carboxypeptidase-like regulatory domain-containing protein [Prevotella sp.]